MPVRDNVMDFEADLYAFAAKTNVEIELVVKRVVFELFRKIIQRTPIDTGRAASSWYVSKDEPGDQVPPEGVYEPPDTATMQAAIDGISFDPPEGVYWIYSNLPYIESLEFGLYPANPKHKTGKTVGGFSVQAPQGMVRVSIAEVEADIYEQA